MKVVQINSVSGYGSTGKICVGISKVLNNHGIENYILYSEGKSDYSQSIKCSEFFPKFQALKSRIKGNYGFNSNKTTKRLILELERIKPDIVHLHNLHSHNCNLEVLMDYLRNNNIKVIWTFHDCWAFTAYCPHFVMAKCEQWKTGCNKCVQYKSFSWIKDRSEWLYDKKRNSVSGLSLTIVTPSQWLADLVNQSFLQNYPVKVINNGIDLSVFKPIESDFRIKNGISEEQFLILGVAIQWVQRKGLDVLIRLAERLDSKKFRIVLVGTDDVVDKQLPENVISIHRTSNQQELAEIYSAADLFVNPTREEVFGLVNVEANACGTPVLTFRTGGSPECIDEKSGMVVDCDDEEALYDAIINIECNKSYAPRECIERAMKFNTEVKFLEYLQLYLNV